MLLLQIKQAEVALKDGRLDEAYQLVLAPQLRNHRRGQSLVNELIPKLLDRARAHLAGGRPMPALIDCQKVQDLGGNLDEAAALRNQIEQSILEKQQVQREMNRTNQLQTAAKLVDSAVGRQDLDTAVAELVRARSAGADDSRLRQLDVGVRNTLRSQIERNLLDGRLDQVDPLLDRLMRLDPESLLSARLQRAVDQIRSALRAIETGNHRTGLEALQRLAMQYPEAQWIKEAAERVSAAAEALEAIRVGPLGLLHMTEPEGRHFNELPQAKPSQPASSPQVSANLPPRMLLQVDGVGSYMILTIPQVTLGPISSSKRPDVALLADASAAILNIERVEDDYFLRIGASDRKLLSNGEKINLSPRCGLTFGLPNPSSTSAVLDLSSARLPRGDVRRIILLDGDLILGASAAHVRVDQLNSPIVLQARQGRLWWRQQPIEWGKPTTIGGVSMVLTESV